MTFELKCCLSVILSFLIGITISPYVIKLMKRLKVGQVILEYVGEHSEKDGTPTMGGVIFIVPIVVVTLIFAYSSMTLVATLTIMGYALIGFLDDYIKIKTHKNMGLKPYQKIMGQLGIAIILAFYVYKNPVIGSSINIPFSNKIIDLSYFCVPFCIFLFIASTNAVNLTDGLDGLATSVSIVYFITFCIVTLVCAKEYEGLNQSIESKEMQNLSIFALAFVGGLLAFVTKNFNPAKIFMGDTGSLAIGGGVACIAIFSRNPLLIPIVGIMYVVSCISVIMQVISYKMTKRRVFLMAPYHHHLT